MLRRLLMLLAALLMTTPVVALESVTLQLKWKHQFQFAGYYAAVEKGYYRDAGLEVRLLEATPKTNTVTEVLSGRAQYGIGNSDLLLDSTISPVVVLAVVFQHSPLMLMARRDRISRVQQLAGKTVMIEQNANEVLAYLKREGVSIDTLNFVPHTLNPEDLLSGKIAAISAYTTHEPYLLRQHDIPLIEFSPREAGIDFYGDNLFTSEDELRSHPERVRAFREATLRGWEYAVRNPGEIISLIMSRYNTQGLDWGALEFEAERTLPLIAAERTQIGQMSIHRWHDIADVYVRLGLREAGEIPAAFLYNAQPEPLPRWLLPVTIVALILLGLLAVITIMGLRLTRKLKREAAVNHELLNKLRQNETIFTLITENTRDVIWILDLTTQRYTYMSPSVERMRGYTAAEVMAQPMEETLSPEAMQRIMDTIARHTQEFNENGQSNPTRTLEVQLRHRDGHTFDTEMVGTYLFDDSGRPVSIVGITRDISERKRRERQLRDQATHDSLTELYNRRYLDENLPRELARIRHDGGSLAVIMMDLDFFKRVNDTYGHDVGDEVLRQLAAVLRQNARAGDIACRYGGEEFVLVLPGLDADMALARTEALRAAVSAMTVMCADTPIKITISAGIAIFPTDSSDADALIKCADLALYQAKRKGRNRSERYSPESAQG